MLQPYIRDIQPTCTTETAKNTTSVAVYKNLHRLTNYCHQALYGGLYNEQNVAISGIHTHSGPGGYLQFVLYDITSLGFVRESYDALVFGILEVRCLCAHFQERNPVYIFTTYKTRSS